MVYFPRYAEATIRTELLGGDTLAGWWFNPRTGEYASIGSWARTNVYEVAPPTSVEGEDWVLMIDDSAKGYPAP